MKGFNVFLLGVIGVSCGLMSCSTSAMAFTGGPKAIWIVAFGWGSIAALFGLLGGLFLAEGID